MAMAMGRYTRLLDKDHGQTEAPLTPTTTPAPTSAFSSGRNMANMFASLKDSATSAGGSVRESMNKASGSVRTGLGIPSATDDSDAQSESSSVGVVEEISEFCPKLTFRHRVTGFGICFTCGYLMTFMSFRLFIKLVEGNPAPFVFLYSSGNILSLGSSMFLSGPKRQFQNMFDEKRKITSVTYLVALTCSIAVCFVPMPTGPKIGLLVLLSASLWYTLSYVPYGRATAKRMIQSAFSGDD